MNDRSRGCLRRLAVERRRASPAPPAPGPACTLHMMSSTASISKRGCRWTRRRLRQARQQADRQAVGMEERQHAEDAAAAVFVPAPGAELEGIGHQILVRQHHGLGRRGGAAGRRHQGDVLLRNDARRQVVR